MGKRERRRRRERAGGPPRPLSIPRRHDQWPTYVRYTGDEMTLQLEVLVERRREAEAAVEQEVDRLVRFGVGWPLIADALEVSRQAARQRWLRRQPQRRQH